MDFPGELDCAMDTYFQNCGNTRSYSDIDLSACQVWQNRPQMDLENIACDNVRISWDISELDRI